MDLKESRRHLISKDEAYKNLAIAVVVQAVKDYRKALQKLEINPENGMAKREKYSCENFFKQGWVQALTDTNGQFIIRNIQNNLYVNDDIDDEEYDDYVEEEDL